MIASCLVKRKKSCFQYLFSVFCRIYHQKTGLFVYLYSIHFQFSKKVDLNTENEYNFSMSSFFMNMNTVAYS